MMRRLLHSAAVAALALAPTFAFAHPDIVPPDQTGFLTGLLHPLTGADHLAAMLAVGLWAAMLGGRAIWAVPLSFVGLLVAGAAAGAAGIAIPAAIEPMIAASVVVLGLAVAFSLRVPVVAAAALVGIFALFHGQAHGVEMPTFASPLLYGLGFVLTTTALYGGGVALGYGLGRTRANWVPRLAGQAIAVFGLLLIVGV